MITSRLKQILLFLLKEEKPIPVQRLADAAGVSKRTVQRELSYLPAEMKQYHLTFQSKTGRGIWIEGSEEDKKQFRQYLMNSDSDGFMDKEERRRRLILELLKDKEPRKLYYFSNQFQVSEATVSNDLEAVEGWFAQYNLKIRRRPGYGICMEGTERNCRLAIRGFLQENMDSALIRDFYEDTAPSEETEKREEQDIYRMLDRNILERVIWCVQEIDHWRLKQLTESSYTGLILHITIAVNRILKKELIEENVQLYHALQIQRDFELAQIIVEALEREFDIEIPRMELAYICLHIQASKSQYIGKEEARHQSYKQELMTCVLDMIDAFDPEIAYRLKQDEEFIDGLLAHLQPTVIRLVNHMYIGNPMLEQIKEEYPDIFAKCLNVNTVVEEYLDCKVPEEETGFFAIHFGAALQRLENQKENHRQVEIGIVCASGIGIARLMLTRMSRFLGNRVKISTWSREDVTPYAAEGIDFFVSSIHFEFEGADILYVDPLLPDKDLERIEGKVKTYALTPAKRKIENDFSRQLEQVNYLAVQIKSMVKELRYFLVDPEISFEALLEKAAAHLTPYSDRQQQICQDIAERERMASQFFAGLGFGLLHTRTAGVTRPVFMILRTNTQEPFTAASYKGSDVVLLMLIPRDEHIQENSDMFGYLSTSLIEDDDFMDIIRDGDEAVTREKFNQLMRQYFNAYLEKL